MGDLTAVNRWVLHAWCFCGRMFRLVTHGKST